MIQLNTIVFLCIISMSVSCWVTRDYYTTKYENVISGMVQEHNRILNEETNRLLDKQKELDELKESSVAKYEESKSQISFLESRVDSLIKSGSVRLRDPNKSTNCVTTTETPRTTSSTDEQGGDELPPETARFLWGEASRADSLVAKLTSCQDYVKQITKAVNTPKSTD